jgi:hypothetical protein
MQCVPAADPTPWLALSNVALGTSGGHAYSADHLHHAIVLSTHESGAAAVLVLHGPEISAATSIPRMQHWALCLHIVGLRLHEAFETEQLNIAVLQLERTERLQRALFTIADLSNAALDMPALLRCMPRISTSPCTMARATPRTSSTTRTRMTTVAPSSSTTNCR